MKLTQQRNVWTFIIESGAIISYGISVLFVLNLLRLGSGTLGDFVALTQAIQSTQGTLSGVAGSLGRIYEDGLFLTDLERFLDLPNEAKVIGAKTIASLKKGIEVSGLTYSYPGADECVLVDVSFRIGRGERIAIVGENGAGKTTLVKCLLGLYPYKGKILFDGIELRDIDPASLRKKFTVLFQDYLRYQSSLRENIGIGDATKEWEDVAIGLAAKNAGIDGWAESLIRGYDTPLGRLFSGAKELSEGQWQQVSLARAFFRDSEVFVLDEPTASLDPRAEVETIERFATLSQGKSGIFISHRLGTTRLADRIMVLKGGRLVEEGTFSDLVARGGHFAELYRMQAHWYKEEDHAIDSVEKRVRVSDQTTAWPNDMDSSNLADVRTGA